MKAQLCRLVLLGLHLALLSSGCSPSSERAWPIELRFADYVAHQKEYVSTELISAAEGVGIERLGFGWAKRNAKGRSGYTLTMKRPIARISFFSADGGISRFELEGSWSKDPGDYPVGIDLLLNGTGFARIGVGSGATRHEIEFPQGSIRAGENLLQLQRDTSSSRKQKGNFRLQSLRFFSKTERTVGLERPSTIELELPPSDSSTHTVIRMPAESYLDMVATLPEEARLVGSYSVHFLAPDGRTHAMVYAELLDETGTAHMVFSRKVRASRGERSIDRNLHRWRGELVRLRLGISGSARAVVRWQDPRIVGQGYGSQPDKASLSTPMAPPSSSRLARPDVFVILLDAARADVFSCYGGPHPTPSMDGLADQGTRFSRALSPSSWTGQSVASVMTGFYPDAVGITNWGSRLPDTVPTLAELMQEVGYTTLLWSQHPYYRVHKDFRRGFDQARIPGSGRLKIGPLAELLAATERPTFAFVHLLPPHTPYEPPAPFRGALSSWYQGDTPVTARYLNQFPNRRQPQELSPEDLRYIRDRYLENVAYADSLIGEILDSLREQNRYNDALIVIISDHGEAFGEHDSFLHSRWLYDEFVRIPFVIKWPRQVKGFESVIEETVSLIDLVPTLADGLGLRSDSGFQGVSLLPVVFDGERPERTIYATTRASVAGSQPPSTNSMFQSGDWKILYDQVTLRTELYLLSEDRDEKRDLSAERPLRNLWMHQELLRQITLNESISELDGEHLEAEQLDPEVLEQLRALGYLD